MHFGSEVKKFGNAIQSPEILDDNIAALFKINSILNI